MTKKIIDIFPPKHPTPFREEDLVLTPEEKKSRGTGKKIMGLVFFLLALLVSIGLIFHFVLAEVKIKIWPQTQVLNFEEKITADLEKKDTDSAPDKVISAKLFETEKISSQEFPSSGKVIKEEKARGQIRVFNNYHLSQTLVANTRFQPPLEKILYFRSTKTVVIPQKSTLDIEVVADRSGEEYNIEPSTFSIPGLAGLPQYYSIYGKSFSPMTGGYKGDIPQVTKEDIEQAKNVLTEKLFTEAKEFLKGKIPPDFVLVDGATKEEVLEAFSSVEAGTETQSFNFRVNVKSRAIVFKKSDLENFAKEFILAQTPEDKKIKEDSLKIDYSPESIDFSGGKIILKLGFSAKIYSGIDTSSLKEKLKKKSLDETKAILENQPQVVKIQINPWPFWIKRVPENLDRIEISLNLD